MTRAADFHGVVLVGLLALAGCFEDSNPAVDDDASPETEAPGTASVGETGTSGQPTSTTAAGSGGTTVVTSADASGTTGGGSSGETPTSLTDTAEVTSGGTTEATDTGETVCGFIDEFGDGLFDSRWNLEHPSSLEETNGAAVILISPPVNDAYPRLEVLPEFGFIGAQAVVQTATLPAVRGTQLNVFLAARTEDAVVVSLNYTSELRFEVHRQGQGGEVETLYDQPYASVGAPWSRIVENAGTLYVEVSDDGTSYTPLVDFVAPFVLDDAIVGIAGNNWEQLNGPSEVAIERFEFRCSPP